MKTRLYRSRTDSMLGGVCGGLGPYLGVDPVLIRLFFVLLTVGGGAGALIYFVLCSASTPPLGVGGEARYSASQRDKQPFIWYIANR